MLFKDVFPDKATERKILSFSIKCPSEGCDWTGELRSKEVNKRLHSLWLHSPILNKSRLLTKETKDTSLYRAGLCSKSDVSKHQ